MIRETLAPPRRSRGSGLDYLRRNREVWSRRAAEYVDAGRRAWASPEPCWGIWGIPESKLHVLRDVVGRDIIELGCGTGYVSAWLARREARVVGIDNSPVQLASARRFQQEFNLHFPLIQASAEAVPFPDARFDLAISEYGAAIWSDPYLWIPEAARLLRPGGELIFMANSAILMLCMPDESNVPASDHMIRDYFGMYRFDWADEESTEFHLPHGEWIRLLRASGFEVEDLSEVQAPEEATTRYEFVTSEWARRWPAEEIWKARRV
jgi:SAM-dependent methyltransferase